MMCIFFAEYIPSLPYGALKFVLQKKWVYRRKNTGRSLPACEGWRLTETKFGNRYLHYLPVPRATGTPLGYETRDSSRFPQHTFSPTQFIPCFTSCSFVIPTYYTQTISFGVMPPPLNAGTSDELELDTAAILHGLNAAQLSAVTTPAKVVQILAPRTRSSLLNWSSSFR